MTLFPLLVSGWLFLVGLYGMVTSRHLVHLIICLTVVQSSTYVLLLAVGYVSGAPAPVWSQGGRPAVSVDPVVQALTLTDIVVEATVTALLLALAVRAYQRFGTADPSRLRPLEG